MSFFAPAKPITKILAVVLVFLVLFIAIRFIWVKPQQVFADSLFTFNEGYGTSTNDNNGNVSAGTIANAVWKTEDLCKESKCLYFDGTGDKVTFADDADLDFIAADNFTLNGWFRTPDITSGTRVLIAKHNATAAGYKVYMDSNGYLLFGVDDDSTFTPDDSASTSTTAFDDNKWHFFSAVKTGTTSITIYVDGIQYQTDSSLAATGTLANSDSFLIGIDGDGASNGFSGFLDGIKVYRSARTAAEIKTDIAGETPSRGVTASFGPDTSYLSNGLVGYWKMDETSGNPVDSSGNGTTLTNSGTTTFATGKYANGASLNGISQYFSATSNTPLSVTGDLTLSSWIKPAANTAATQYDITGKWDGDNTSYLLTQYGAEIRLYLNSSGNYVTSTNANMSTGTWYQVLATYSAGTQTVKLFLNGTQLTTTTTGIIPSSINSNSGAFYVGADAHASNLFSDGFESGNLTAWSSSVTDGGNLSATSDAAIYGAYGLSALINDANAMYVRDNTPANEHSYRLRFYLDPNSITMSDNNEFVLFEALNSSNSQDYFVKLQRLFPGNYKLFIYRKTDTGAGEGAFQTSALLDAPNYVEINFTASSSPGANDGTIQVWLNGVSQGSVTGIDNDTKTVDWVRLGAISEIDAGTSGTIFLDDFVSNNDGTPIGDYISQHNLYNGTIDETRIYNRALSPAEVQKLYNFAPGPVGYWKLDENTGTSNVFDSSTYGHTLTMNGSMLNSDWMPGVYGSSLNFDGTNDFLNISDDNDLDPNDEMAVEFWIKLDQLASTKGEDIRIVKKEYSLSPFLSYNVELRSATDDVFFDWVNTSGTGYSANSFNDMTSINTWYHVAAVKSGTGLKIYINGIDRTESSSTTTGTLLNGDGDLKIGASAGSSRRLDGKLDDVKIYNYARTPGQVIEDMNAGHPAPGSPVGSSVAYWKMDEGYGTSANDGSINANTLTLSTASWTNSGKYGKAFNGLDNVRLSRTTDADLEFGATEDFTLSLWYKSDSASNPGATEYLMNDGAAAGSAGYAIYANTDGTLCFGIDDDITWGPDVASCTATDVYDNIWHHVTAVRNVALDKTYIYLDAVEKDSDTDSTTATLDSSPTFYIGDANGTDGTDEFIGDIDEVKIFRSALSPDAIKVLYNQSAGQSLGALSTDSSGNASYASQREYCPPGNTETNCGSGDPSPFAHYDFDTNTGTPTTLFDKSGNGFSGTIGGSMTADDWVPGKYGSALDFDGTDDVANIYSAGLDTSFDEDHGTIAAWVRIPLAATWTDSTLRPAVALAASTTNLVTIRKTTTANQFEMRYTTAGSANVYTLATSTSDWFHATITWDRPSTTTTIKYYINGILQEIDTTGTDWTPGAALGTVRANIGARLSDGSDPFKGQIDDVRIYNYARTPAQIAWDYNLGKPVGWWKLDENTGTTTNDSSGNAYHSQTFTGNTTWTTGKFNTGLTFDGTDDNVRITEGTGIDVGALTDSYSVSAWMKTSSVTTDRAIVYKYDNTGAVWPIKLYLDGSDFPCFSKKDTNGNAPAWCGSRVVNDGQWHLLSAVIDATLDTGQLYVDGILVDTGADGTDATSVNNMDISFGNGGTSYIENDFNGQIDDVRIYNYALTTQQVKTVMNEGAAVRFGPATGSP